MRDRPSVDLSRYGQAHEIVFGITLALVRYLAEIIEETGGRQGEGLGLVIAELMGRIGEAGESVDIFGNQRPVFFRKAENAAYQPCRQLARDILDELNLVVAVDFIEYLVHDGLA